MKTAIKWTAIILLLAALAGGGAIYMLANRVPADYRPSQLPPRERQQRAEDFVDHVMNGFANGMQLPDPFTWTVSEDELNGYLASIDEIAYLRPHARRGEVNAALAKAGLAAPAIALKDGRLTLMIRSTEFDKVLSADLSFTFPSPGRLQVNLLAVRAGTLPAPASMVPKLLGQLQTALTPQRPTGATEPASREPAERAAASGPKPSFYVEDVAAILLKAVGAIDRKPISTDLPVRVNGRSFRIDNIEIRPGELSIHVSPIQPNGPDAER